MNERFNINLEQVRKKHRNKCSIRTKTYEKLLEKCYHRIDNASDNDKNYCLFFIPEFILGMPTYNLAYCAAYIMYCLRKNGFETKFFNPNIILITWRYEEPSYINDDRKSISFDRPKLISTTKTLQLENKPNNYRSITDYKPSGNFIHN